jgi:hypothetical protein
MMCSSIYTNVNTLILTDLREAIEISKPHLSMAMTKKSYGIEFKYLLGYRGTFRQGLVVPYQLGYLNH